LPAATITESGNDNAVRVFGSSATPIAALRGPTSQIGIPFGVAYGPDGLLYVVNNDPPAILAFAPGVSGDCAPVRAISGAQTGLGTTWVIGSPAPLDAGIAFDAAGNLYVASTQNSAILVFAPGVSGDVAPIRTISGAATGLNGPRQITFDAAGGLWVANRPANSVTEYAPGASGNVSPLVTMTGPATGINKPWGVTFDADGCLWVANAGPANAIVVFMRPFTTNQVPKQTISGPNTGFNNPYGLSVDTSRNVWVANQLAGNLEAFADNSSGNVAPVRTITGVNETNFVTFRP
jgi:sugar lactone lactonase YvrE